MPAKPKAKTTMKKVAPKIRVEEVKEVEEVPAESPKEVTPTKPEPSVPRVSSFSQLDSKLDVSEDDNSSDKPSPEEKEEKESEVKPDEDKEAATNSETDDKEMKSSTDVKEWLKDIRPDTSKDVEKSAGSFNGKLFFGLLLVFILLGALAGGLYYYKQRVQPENTNPPKTTEPTIAPNATPVPEQKVDLTTYSVNVLNGSGVAGQAGVVQDLLVAVGFSKDKMKAGNASAYDYKDTEIQVKSSVGTLVTDAVTKALGEKYSVKLVETKLKDTSTYDIVVTVGTKK